MEWKYNKDIKREEENIYKKKFSIKILSTWLSIKMKDYETHTKKISYTIIFAFFFFSFYDYNLSIDTYII